MKNQLSLDICCKIYLFGRHETWRTNVDEMTSANMRPSSSIFVINSRHETNNTFYKQHFEGGGKNGDRLAFIFEKFASVSSRWHYRYDLRARFVITCQTFQREKTGLAWYSLRNIPLRPSRNVTDKWCWNDISKRANIDNRATIEQHFVIKQ